MRVLHTVCEMRSACEEVRWNNGARLSLGFVPTMGALHDGHLSLVRAARKRCKRVAVSIFVNPTQFGPKEDLTQYPRPFELDSSMLEAEGVDLLFAPSVEEMYPGGGMGTFVDVPNIGGRLDGRSRVGHFRGVATVVSKLLHIVSPDAVFLGQKDAAQVAVLRAMVQNLNFGVDLAVCPIVRDQDGLALSSRNRYLSAKEREQALALYRSLQAVKDAFAAGVLEVPYLRSLLQQNLESVDQVRVEYAEIVDPDFLEPANDFNRGALVAVAARVGNTRLIDNILLPPVAAKERMNVSYVDDPSIY